MNCKFDEIMLYEYIDGELNKEDKIMVNNHLSLCPECRKKLSEIKLLFYEIDNIDEVVIPKEVADIRANVIDEAFIEKATMVNKAYNSINTNYKKTKVALENTPIINKVLPTKENTLSLIKGTYKTGKKLYKVTKKEKEAPKKKGFKKLGDLL